MKYKHIGSILLISYVLLGCSVNNATNKPKKELALSKDMVKSTMRFLNKSAAYLVN